MMPNNKKKLHKILFSYFLTIILLVINFGSSNISRADHVSYFNQNISDHPNGTIYCVVFYENSMPSVLHFLPIENIRSCKSANKSFYQVPKAILYKLRIIDHNMYDRIGYEPYQDLIIEKKQKYLNVIKNPSYEVVEVKRPKITTQKRPAQKKTLPSNKELITIGSGSGFYINKQGYALTNDHVVSICRQSVSIIDGKEILFRVIGADKANDIAIIKADTKPSNYIKINTDGAKLGENIVAVGYPLAGRLSDSVKITKGIVSSLTGLNNNIGQIQIDAALQPGNSGGPVLNEDGVLVGMASAGLNKLLMAKEAKYIPENVNFAVASPIIVNVLKNKKIKYSSPSFFGGNYSSTELAEIGRKSTIQLFCRNTRDAYAKLKRSKKYSQILLDLE